MIILDLGACMLGLVVGRSGHVYFLQVIEKAVTFFGVGVCACCVALMLRKTGDANLVFGSAKAKPCLCSCNELKSFVSFVLLRCPGWFSC